MTDPEDIPVFNMLPPQFVSSHNDAIEVMPQFPMNNELFEPCSSLDRSHSFKRPRMSDDYKHSNALMGTPPRMNQPPPNRRPEKIFFKTRICFSFRVGTCRNGENCSYAHGIEELRQPPPNWQELARPKMKLCKKYCNSEECPYGDKCNFLHEDPAKFRDDSCKTRESSAITIPTIGNNLEDKKTVTKPPRGTYWKTKICLRWLNTGSCPFGDDCHFTHGDAEVQVARGVETEAAVTVANSKKAAIPSLPSSVLEAKEDEKKTKKHLLWLKLNKINRIYGDWIDD